MDLSDFINNSECYKNKNSKGFSVIIILKNGISSTLTVLDCKTEYEAKEQAYLYLTSIIKNKNKK